MFKEILYFLSIASIQICLSKNLRWNTKRPFKYSGYIYTDSNVVIVDPILQVLLTDGEEICNFQLNQSDYNKRTANFNPFRAIVKSAHMGLGEVELKPNVDLKNQGNANFDLIIIAEACHNPDTWSEPAEILIKVMDPPEPLWAKSSYNATISNDAIKGSFVTKVTAYLPRWADPNNKICQYELEQSLNNSFTIDGSGTITTRENLLNTETTIVTLNVLAKDCSQPTHRQSKVNVFVTINPICKFGWTGFYKSLNYRSGIGVSPLWDKPFFQFCHNDSDSFNQLIKNCQKKQKFRVTVSVELRSVPRSYGEPRYNDVNVCYLDNESLKLQRKICDIDEKKLLDLLSMLSKQKKGVMKFPQQSNVFPGMPLAVEEKFSIYFWMRRTTPGKESDEFIVCQLDDSIGYLFSVSINLCNLKIYVHSYQDKDRQTQFPHSGSRGWEFHVPQTCDDKWHNYLFIIYRTTDNSPYPGVRVFIDSEMIEYKNKGQDVKPTMSFAIPASNRNHLFVGQCSNFSDNSFKGYLAGLILLPGIILKSSNVRCLMKCMERLHFNGMNQMNPGMSVSLNSEMQTIIINGHNVEEVGKLINVMGYVNPKWNPIPGSRVVSIQTDMSCEKRTFNVPVVEIKINVSKQNSPMNIRELISSIKLYSNVKTFEISNYESIQSSTGVGLAIFENITLNIIGIPQSTQEKLSEDTVRISRCIVSIHPELIRGKEYVEWSQQAIETFKAEKYSMEVRNNSKKIIFYGEYSPQIYQFIIQHLRYFSSPSSSLGQRLYRKFQLQCSTDVGVSIINSNTLVIKVSFKRKNERYESRQSTETYKEQMKSTISETPNLRKELNKSKDRMVEMRAHSGIAKFVETEFHSKIGNTAFREPTRINKNVYKYFLAVGILILIFSLFIMAKRMRQIQRRNGCVLSFRVIDCICFPLQSMKEKIKPISAVRVELSRDFIHRTLSRRIDVGLEMQWDDAELTPDSKYHIIENPIFEKTHPEFDDNYLNNNIPPICEKEDFTSDDETEEETDLENNEKSPNNEKRIKNTLIDL